MYFFLSLQGFFNSLVFVRGRNMKTPEGRFFQKLVCCKCSMVGKLTLAHRARPPTNSTFGLSEKQSIHSDVPDTEDTEAPRRSSFLKNQELAMPVEAESIHDDARDEENTDTPRRVSFVDQELVENVHDNDRDEDYTDTTRRVCFIDQELAMPEETESIHGDAHDKDNTRQFSLIDHELSIPN
jgi:hypothetical protein